ncbi:hypothetical protein [Methanococcoides alaskense]|uniref:Metal-dependent hydrolase n=1 Tax=Methanococcoides alaskense TaxID=325778 RepID=A0AA90TYL7_9EURY|nr:hypothetical protein [Methanococcoides alaskense]MDA0525546.1 hypothetical protein [Methanococcoides alaskense]MDR6222327.1 putative metal-dependent hydrolase [Methanococcoides alaskense]
MNNKILKTIGCFAAILMVFSLFPTGALAAEDSTTKDLSMMKFGEKNRMGHGIGGGFFLSDEDDMSSRTSDDRPACPVEFESEADEFEFQKERLITSFDKKIERLETLKENLDNIGNEEITEELIDDHIVQLEDAKELISSTEDKEEINEVMESLSSVFEDMSEELRGPNSKMHDDRPLCPVELESEEDAFEFHKERLITSFDKRIERLETLKENLDEIGNDDITEELIDEHIVQLEDTKELISSAEDKEEINEVRGSLSSVFEDMPEELRGSNSKMHLNGPMNGMHSRGMASVEE